VAAAEDPKNRMLASCKSLCGGRWRARKKTSLPPPSAPKLTPIRMGNKRKTAIYINFAANGILLVAKLSVAVLTNSLSVLASLVDGWGYFFSIIGICD